DPQAEDRTVQLSEIRETHTAQGNDHSLLEDTQHLNLLDEELDDPLASLIITGATKETALSPEDTTSLSGQSYHQSIGTILELLSTQGVLAPTEILSTAAPIDGTETQSGGIDTSDETTTSVIPLSDLLGSGISPVFTDPQTTTNTASDGFVVVTTSGGGSIMETVLGDDPTLLGGDPTLPII
ncbi:hypothetical protein, partial [uncultured Kiloniella sp.]|uniref:hypothetical protein n=1 Tax=uncultured Kiloniella sp. TaxID=1133091 RepID=UPI002601E9DC